MAGVNHSIHTFEVKRGKPRPLTFYANLGKRWAPSAMKFGMFSGMMFLYFTDWKVFMTKVPYYGSKFDEKEPVV